MPRRVHIVPHTHWDREWYATFQTFRLRLVDLLDEFLPQLERDSSYAHFLLDGQMAVVDDYLEVRPDAEPLIRRLAASGRIAVGPWYILMDEFLVSAETIVRDLQMGFERAAAFGGADPVGYLPDMFGHVAQMPQILQQAGIDNAVVWRGVPSSIDRTGFWWSAPDGSTVRAEYLPAGYGNGAAIPDDAKALVKRIRSHEAELGDRLPPGAPMLWMNGTDHQVPQAWLGRVVAEANQIQDDYELAITSLHDHLSRAPTDGLPAWTGELRSGARSNLLMGVASNRVDVKQAAARAERALERYAEPLCALFIPPERWPTALLAEAWRLVVRNAAHDSVCACSIDPVVDAVLHRYGEATDIGHGLAERAVAWLAFEMATEGTIVVNPTARDRSAIVEIVLDGAEPPAGTQLVSAHTGMEIDVTVKGRELGTWLGMVRSQQLTDDTFVNGIEIDEQDDQVEVTFSLDSRLRESLDVEEIKRSLYALAGARPDDDFLLRGSQAPSVKVLAHVPAVPAFGWTTWTPGSRDGDAVAARHTGGAVVMTNGRATVEVEAEAGTFSLDGVAGLGHLVDDGDEGDTYNWSPPENDVVVAGPDDVQLEVVADGPLVGRVRVRRSFRWPERIVDGARTGEVTIGVDTLLELRIGEPFVRVTTTIDNRARDHRLRAWFPLPERATTSSAECAFAVVERGLEAEGGPTERPLPTFPSRRFVQAGGLTLVHEGLLEYELVDDGAALALTLLRATGMLSRVQMAMRPVPAGPPVAAEGAQMPGPLTVRYAVHVGDADPYELADAAFVDLPVAAGPGGGRLPETGQVLAVHGAEVSAVQRRHGAVELRIFNPSPEPAQVEIPGRRGWLVDLRDRPLEPFDGTFPLDPWRFTTVRLDG